jgi:hypothetical protein
VHCVCVCDTYIYILLLIFCSTDIVSILFMCFARAETHFCLSNHSHVIFAHVKHAMQHACAILCMYVCVCVCVLYVRCVCVCVCLRARMHAGLVHVRVLYVCACRQDIAACHSHVICAHVKHAMQHACAILCPCHDASICTSVCAPAYPDSCKLVHVYGMRVLTCMRVHTCLHRYVHAHMNVHIYMHAYIQMHVQTYVSTNIHICDRLPSHLLERGMKCRNPG